MAKYRRYRKYSRRNRARWSANIFHINTPPAEVPPGLQGDSVTIAQNPGQNTNSVSQTFTVKNVEVSAQLEISSTENPHNIDNIEYYILYVPEGQVIDSELPDRHPEWILAYKYIGTGISMSQVTTSNAQVPRIRTRLARKLNTGDSVIFLYRLINKSSLDSPDVKVNGLVRWWTKAN